MKLLSPLMVIYAAVRVIYALKRAAVRSVEFFNKHKGESLVSSGLLPSYFSEIPSRLKALISKIKSNGDGEKTIQYRIGGGTDLFVQKWEDLYKSDVSFLNAMNLMKKYMFQEMNVS